VPDWGWSSPRSAVLSPLRELELELEVEKPLRFNFVPAGRPDEGIDGVDVGNVNKEVVIGLVTKDEVVLLYRNVLLMTRLSLKAIDIVNPW
jgi:hypothetical protein